MRCIGLAHNLADATQNLPNIDHPDFAAVDFFFNRLKASWFVVNGGIPNVGNANRALNAIQQQGIVAAFVAFPDVITEFRRTHERLYQILGVWDQGFEGCGVPGLGATWAATYSEWMTRFVSSFLFILLWVG